MNAVEARKIAKEVRDQKSFWEYSNVKAQIATKAKEGKFEIEVDSLLTTTIDKLRGEGYSINRYSDLKEGSFYRINW